MGEGKGETTGQGGCAGPGSPGGESEKRQEEKRADGGRFTEWPPQNTNHSRFLGVRALNGPEVD